MGAFDWWFIGASLAIIALSCLSGCLISRYEERQFINERIKRELEQ